MSTKKTTLKDIAQLAGVSLGTVDRVMNNRGEVAEVTRQRILEITKNVGYHPDIFAKTLASKKIFKIAVCIPESGSESEFWESPMEGIERAVQEITHFGITINKFLFNQFSKKSFKIALQNVMDHSPDAVVVAPVFSREVETISSFCNQKNIPYIFINSRLQGYNQLTFIGQDEIQSGKVAGNLVNKYMSSDGEVLIVNQANVADEEYYHLKKRKNGFKISTNRRIHEINIETNIPEKIDRVFLDTLHNYPQVQGVFVTNSKAHKIAQALKDYDRHLFVIGYDLIPANLAYLKDDIIDILISQRPFDQGYLSIKALFNKLLLNKPIEKEYQMPIEIIVKENINFRTISYQL